MFRFLPMSCVCPGLLRRSILLVTFRIASSGFWPTAAALGATLCLTAASPAKAQLMVCNQSLDVLNVALGFDESGEFETEGWWSIGANRCSSVVRQSLTGRYYYLYAEDVFGQPVLSGAVPACVDAKRFRISGTDGCWVRGLREAPFAEIDTQSQSRWTVFLKGAE
jgi:uncharacterized membrane protein